MNNPTTALSDQDLLTALHQTHDRSNRANVDFLIHLAEVDARQLYLPQACSSMFTYCTERLHMAEGVANRSIAVARAGRAFPVVFEMMRRNEVHMTAVAMLAKLLTPDNHQALLVRAKHQSKRAVEQLVAELQPRAPAADVIRKLPVPRATSSISTAPAPKTTPTLLGTAVASGLATEASLSSLPATPQTSAPATGAASAATPAFSLTPPEIPARIEPTAPGSYRISFTGDDEFVNLLDEVRDLLAHRLPRKDVASAVRLALLNLRDELHRQKAGSTKRSEAKKFSADLSANAGATPVTDNLAADAPVSAAAEQPSPQPPPSRHIPNHIRREVWARDGGRCTFTSSGGERCTETSLLEYEHLKPFAIHHEHQAEQICLRCRAHNQWSATLVYGKEHMAKFRRDG